MTTHSTTTAAVPTSVGRCLTCGEHVAFGAGRLTGVGVTHLDDRGCARALRYLDEPLVLTEQAPAWASAQIEPDDTPFGTPAGQWSAGSDGPEAAPSPFGPPVRYVCS